jgi:hypothetical protein
MPLVLEVTTTSNRAVTFITGPNVLKVLKKPMLT